MSITIFKEFHNFLKQYFFARLLIHICDWFKTPARAPDLGLQGRVDMAQLPW